MVWCDRISPTQGHAHRRGFKTSVYLQTISNLRFVQIKSSLRKVVFSMKIKIVSFMKDLPKKTKIWHESIFLTCINSVKYMKYFYIFSIFNKFSLLNKRKICFVMCACNLQILKLQIYPTLSKRRIIIR